MNRWHAYWLLAGGLLLGLGCARAPSWPAYENQHVGIAFQPPIGWSERAHEDAVSRSRPGERLVVQYKRLQAGNPAWFRVTVMDTPAGTSGRELGSALKLNKGWQPLGPPQCLEIAGASAHRALGQGRVRNRELVSETVAILHGQRLYRLIGVYPADDPEAQDQVRQAVASVRWLPSDRDPAP